MIPILMTHLQLTANPDKQSQADIMVKYILGGKLFNTKIISHHGVFGVDSNQSSQDEFWIICERSKRWYWAGIRSSVPSVAGLTLITTLSTHRLVSAVSPRISAAHQNISSEWTLCCFPSPTWLQLTLSPGAGPAHRTRPTWAAHWITRSHRNTGWENNLECHKLGSVHNLLSGDLNAVCGSQQVRALTERDQHILGEPGPAPGHNTGLLLAARGHVTRIPASHWLPAPGCCPTPGNRFVWWCAQGWPLGRVTRPGLSPRFPPRPPLVSVTQSRPLIGQQCDPGPWYNSWS